MQGGIPLCPSKTCNKPINLTLDQFLIKVKVVRSWEGCIMHVTVKFEFDVGKSQVDSCDNPLSDQIGLKRKVLLEFVDL